MNRHRLALIAAALMASAAASHAATIYSIANDGGTLVRFDSATPGAVTIIGAFSGDTVTLSGMDFRPADGLLYGFNQSGSGIYRVDTQTGATMLLSTASTGVGVPQMGIDFNPVPDRMRVVSASDQNLRINVATGSTIVDGALKYAAGDANFGANPSIIDAAYTNSDQEPATATTLYYIDEQLDVLISTTNPNAGSMNTIGKLGVNTGRFTGFDIFTSGGNNTAFASLTVGGTPGLYTINLATGAATLVGAIAAQDLFGLAVVPGFVPEPGSAALLAAAGLAAFASRRRSA